MRALEDQKMGRDLGRLRSVWVGDEKHLKFVLDFIRRLFKELDLNWENFE